MRVFLPFPVEPALIRMYGPDYRHPVQQWRWALDPFLTGYCQYQDDLTTDHGGGEGT